MTMAWSCDNRMELKVDYSKAGFKIVFLYLNPALKEEFELNIHSQIAGFLLLKIQITQST